MSTLFVYVGMADGLLRKRLGTSEYSYNFVLREFYPLLLEFGSIVRITSLDDSFTQQVADCKKQNEPHCLLFFSAPHNLPAELPCPTIPVFAWEFSDLPSQAFANHDFHDWRQALQTTVGAITHSEFALQRVRNAMDSDFPVWSIPAPVFSKFQHINADKSVKSAIPVNIQTLTLAGTVYDSHTKLTDESTMKQAKDPIPAMNARSTVHIDEFETVMSTAPGQQIDEQIKNEEDIALGGVIYTSILNPSDGRKNWQSLVKTFCWALRDKLDATLVLKFVHHDPNFGIEQIKEITGGLPAFACRILVINSFLESHAYQALMNMSSYAVNVSTGEGQCLPLMEYMSAGIPCVAPQHSAMVDYINHDNAFIVKSSIEPAAIPHDNRFPYSTQQYRVNLDSLASQLRNSYTVAHDKPSTYQKMSIAAISSLRQHCSDEIVSTKLQSVLNEIFNVKETSNANDGH